MNIPSRFFSIAATVLALGIGGFVYAQASQGLDGRSGMHRGMGMRDGASGGMWGGMHGIGQPADAVSRLATTKAELKITAEQAPAWQAFEDVVRQQADTRQALNSGRQARMQDPAATAGVDRTAMRETMQKFRESEQATYEKARQALYAVLSAEQRVLADQRLGNSPGHGRGMGRGRFAG